MDGLAVAGEVVGAATALAGLILVYLGSIAASYASFTTEQQNSVRAAHRWRAWLAFIGLALSLTAAALAVVGKGTASADCAGAAVVVLFLAFAWGIVSALLTVLEVR